MIILKEAVLGFNVKEPNLDYFWQSILSLSLYIYICRYGIAELKSSLSEKLLKQLEELLKTNHLLIFFILGVIKLAEAAQSKHH